MQCSTKHRNLAEPPCGVTWLREVWVHWAVAAAAVARAGPTWRLRLQLQAQLAITHVSVTTFDHHRRVFIFRRGATEGVLEGNQWFEVETAAPQVEPPYITFSRLKHNQRTLGK